jgi:hypothetical protein
MVGADAACGIDAPNDDSIERWYAGVAGHKVFCGNMAAGEFGRYEEICALADHVIAISPFLARMAKVRGDKVSIDTDLFGRESCERHERPRVVGIGKVGADKRPEVFPALAAKFQQVDFAWFGDGNLRHQMLAEIARQGMSNLQFPGAIAPDRLATELAASDILVHPSICEGLPKVTQEAAAAGLAQLSLDFTKRQHWKRR